MIPKIIHHVWPGSDKFKQKFYKFRESWLQHHPDWTFYFWRLDNLPSNINPEVLKILNNSDYSVTVKSDVLRFEIVKIFGGIYVDTDMQCLKPLNELLFNKFFTGKESENYICPSIFGSVKNNKILIDILNKIIYNIKKMNIHDVNKYPNKISGPYPFTDILKNKTLEEATIYPIKYFYPINWKDKDILKTFKNDNSSYTVHHWSGLDKDGWTKTIKFNK